MRIGELAARTGLTTHALRYYERVGLLQPGGRAANRYRVYGDEAVADLEFIRKAQHLGLTLDDIRSALEISARGHRPCDHVRSAVIRHLAAIDVKLAELGSLRRTLAATLRRLDDAPASASACRCAVIESAPLARSLRSGRASSAARYA